MEIRESYKTQNEFLRFQVGQSEIRTEMSPVYERPGHNKVIGHTPSKDKDGNILKVRVWRLLGFGATLDKAKTMAGMR